MRAFVPATVLVCALVVLVTLVPRTAARAADTGVVEVVRVSHAAGGTVERRVLVQADSPDDASAIADSVVGAEDAGVTAQYHVNPWKWPTGSMPVVVRVNSSLEAPRPPLTPAVQNAVEQWSGVSPTTFAFVLGPTTTAAGGLCDNNAHGNADPHTDGVNSVSYSSTLPSGVLGLTCSYQPDDDPTVLQEFDTELNYAINWGAGDITAQQYDLWSTVLHEMGHALGLGHSCFSSLSCTGVAGDAVMNYALGKGQTKRVLTDDDRAALKAQYPLAGPTLPPPSPSPTPFPEFQRNYASKIGFIARTQ